ncbi:hypothetical protein NIES22_65650 [Calothrix brevissima NIES-22]|nr:hypothetical protein NIES22_65650 [Calothrix brevissima NIES-22]
MPYKLVQTSPGNVDITKNLESFLFCYNFTVEKASQNIIISSGIFAAYISQKSGKPFIKSLDDPNNKEKKRKLEISNVAEHKITINNAKLVNSRFSQFSNEVSQLHLFNFEEEDEEKDKREWIETKGWSPKFKNPSKNDDGKDFLKHILEFDQVKDRYIYSLSTQSTSNGTERFALVLPFIANSLIGTVLAQHNKKLPKIQISVDDKPWSYPKSGDQELPGALNGFIMVAEGAFKSIALSGEIDDFLQLVTSHKESDEIIKNLSKIVHRYPTPISRTLNTVSVTSSNSVVPSDPELPMEVFYIEGLNSSNNEVEMIVK